LVITRKMVRGRGRGGGGFDGRASLLRDGTKKRRWEKKQSGGNYKSQDARDQTGERKYIRR